MEYKIKITEGCVNYSYTINDEEWVDILDQDIKTTLTVDDINDVCYALIRQLPDDIPCWMIDYLYDGMYEADCSQDTFIKLVKNNPNTVEIVSGPCSCCGDTIETYELTVKV